MDPGIFPEGGPRPLSMIVLQPQYLKSRACMHPRAIRFSWRFVFPPLVWLLAWLPMPAAVAMDGVSLEAVRQQIDQLKRESRATEEKLRALEQRLRDAEALQQRGKGLPSADPVPPASGAPAAEPEPPGAGYDDPARSRSR